MHPLLPPYISTQRRDGRRRDGIHDDDHDYGNGAMGDKVDDDGDGTMGNDNDDDDDDNDGDGDDDGNATGNGIRQRRLWQRVTTTDDDRRQRGQ